MSRLLVAAVLAALTSPIELEHPRSREAREHLAAREAQPALQAYQALEAEVGPRPEIEIGRGAALHAGGDDAGAAQAFERARGAPEPLGSRALLGLGTALAGKGELDGAIAAYREALRRDPGYAEARQDLEVALRRKVEQQRQQQRSQAEQRPQPGGQQGGSPEPKAGEPGEKAEPRPAQAPQQGQRQAEQRQEQAPGEKPTRDEALRLLDAMRSREQNLPESARQRTARRGHAEKDW